MIAETVKAILTHHEEMMEAKNKVIRDREVELALVIKELQELREKHNQLLSFRGEKMVPADRGATIEGVTAKAKAKVAQ